MPEQNYANHAQKTPLFGVFLLLLMVALVAGCFTIYHAGGSSAQLHNALVMIVVIIAAFGGRTQCRSFALKVQNRAIRSEENLRHFVLTGKLLDKRLTIKQIVAIRFASDDQIVDLARQAAEQSMAPRFRPRLKPLSSLSGNLLSRGGKCRDESVPTRRTWACALLSGDRSNVEICFIDENETIDRA